LKYAAIVSAGVAGGLVCACARESARATKAMQ